MSRGDSEEKAYVQSHGVDLYRRGIYTFWKRSIHYPAFAVFDAPNRESCTVSRPITNTPLQALVTLNDITFVEAARVFAERILRESNESFEDRLDFAFRRALVRPVSNGEAKTIRAIHDDILRHYRENREAAEQIVQIGEYPRDIKADVTQLAVWTAIAQIVLNLDEAMTKE